MSYIKENPNFNFELIGHICCSDKLNPQQDGVNIRTGERNLSEARAKAIFDYLINNNVPSNQLSYVGKAYTQPLGGEDYLDRRVEIDIIRPKKM